MPLTPANPPQALRQAFDEALYLQLNDDVATAVRVGEIASGWEHFFAYGIFEGRPGSPLGIEPQNRFSTPPVHLRKRVHGDTSESSFLLDGQKIALDLDDAVARLDYQFPPNAEALDFGCGCGRVLSWLRLFRPAFRYTGSDIDAEAVMWCMQNLPFGTFLHSPSRPPTKFADSHFDFVFSVSVFTHLPEQLQFMWLDELRRITKPGGYLALSIASETAFDDWMARREGRNFLRRMIAVRKNGRELKARGFTYGIATRTAGLPAFYRAAFHSHAYVKEHWSRFFSIHNVIPRGINEHQDLVICRRD